MVWGYFRGGNREAFCTFGVKLVNARVYLKLLEYSTYTILPVVQCVDNIGDVAFQQDNAPVHTASVVTKWLEQHKIQADEHFSYSPDLNLIEHAWEASSNSFTKSIQTSLIPPVAPML